jgi:hypothetical protein
MPAFVDRQRQYWVRETERLIRKLQINKEILADYGEAESEAMEKVLRDTPQ